MEEALPRRSRGPMLYLKKRPGAPSFWYIRDGARRVATGFGESEHSGALRYLAKYIAQTRTPSFEDGDPHRVEVATVISLYARDRSTKTARPRESARRLERLQTFFGKKTVSHITPATCRAFAEWCGSEQAGRRALEDLRAALIYAWKCRQLSARVPVELPPKSAPRERWLTRSEAAKLIREARSTPHLLRFILIGLYTGTRSSAILDLAWEPHKDGGHVDLQNRVLYRRPLGTRETKKRQPPCRICPELMRHLTAWGKKRRGRYIIEWRGDSIGEVRKSWGRAARAAGLGREVTPHILRHTFVTWALQRGVSIWDVSRQAGMSPQIVESVYGHHALNFGA